MIENNIDSSCAKARSYVKDKRLRDAFRLVRGLVPPTAWRIVSELDRLEEHYALMLNYAMDGAHDPHRNEVHADIASKLTSLIDRVGREAKIAGSSELYFSTARYEHTQPDSIESLIAGLRQKCSDNSAFNAVTSGKKNNGPEEMEFLERRIFNKIWTTFPLSSTDCEVISKIWDDPILTTQFKELTVSALLMGLLSWFEEARLLLLLDAYEAAECKSLGVKAMCAALLAMFIHRPMVCSSAVARRIEALRDTTAWSSDVRMIFLQFIRTRDTEKITRKVRDELLPEMMKLRPEIYKKINDRKALTELADIEENPEWQDLLDNSGVTDKLKELSEMQADGGDVFMSTFAMLKSFPFFNEISNWFLPFSTDHSNVRSALDRDDALGRLLLAFPVLCDSDKYSFALSIAQMPEAQRDMMRSQLQAQNMNLEDIHSTEILPEQNRREIDANRYIHDLYRFFKLFRRKEEFQDPFANPINLVQVKVLTPDLTDPETLRLVGEFYFRREYWADAQRLFGLLSEKVAPEAQLFQKMGYAAQKLGHLDEALDLYQQSELIDARCIWTQRRIAACLKMLGKAKEALVYFRKIEAVCPDDTNVALNIGHCLLELGRYGEAMNQYYKVEFLDEKSSRAFRPIAWCAFLSRDFDTSLSYYHRIMSTDKEPAPTDHLNMGHLYMARKEFREAMKCYKRYQTASGGDPESLIKAVEADRQALDTAGIEPGIIPLVIDAVLYSDN